MNVELTDLIQNTTALFLVKHDALAKNEDSYARTKINQEGLDILHEQMVEFTPDQAKAFYYDKQDDRFPLLQAYITEGKSLAFVVVGNDCYQKLGKLKREMRQAF